MKQKCKQCIPYLAPYSLLLDTALTNPCTPSQAVWRGKLGPE